LSRLAGVSIPLGEVPERSRKSGDQAELVVTKKIVLALAAYVGLGVLAFATLPDERIRVATLAILAMFAVKTWIRRGDLMHPDGGSGRDDEPM
jgi:hypothetical protein